MDEFSYVLFSMRRREMILTTIWPSWGLNVDDLLRFFIH